MKYRRRKERRYLTPWKDERGSTLILVILLTLILSATAIVTLQSVVRTTKAVSVYRTRTQAQLTSDAANRLFANFVGGPSGTTYIDAVEKSLTGDTGLDSGVTGGQLGTPTQQLRKDLITTGGFLEFSHTDLHDVLLPAPTNGETGLFQLDPAQDTFETRRKAQWRVRIRDLTNGLPAVNYGEDFCFKKATIVAEAQIGQNDPDWNAANNVGISRHTIEAMIGPYECQQ